MRGRLSAEGYEFSFESKSEPEEALLRLVAHVFVVMMPRLGLAETVTSLRDILDYNVEQLEIEALDAALPPQSYVTTGPGRVVEVKDRPPMIVGE